MAETFKWIRSKKLSANCLPVSLTAMACARSNSQRGPLRMRSLISSTKRPIEHNHLAGVLILLRFPEAIGTAKPRTERHKNARNTRGCPGPATSPFGTKMHLREYLLTSPGHDYPTNVPSITTIPDATRTLFPIVDHDGRLLQSGVDL